MQRAAKYNLTNTKTENWKTEEEPQKHDSGLVTEPSSKTENITADGCGVIPRRCDTGGEHRCWIPQLRSSKTVDFLHGSPQVHLFFFVAVLNTAVKMTSPYGLHDIYTRSYLLMLHCTEGYHLNKPQALMRLSSCTLAWSSCVLVVRRVSDTVPMTDTCSTVQCVGWFYDVAELTNACQVQLLPITQIWQLGHHSGCN